MGRKRIRPTERRRCDQRTEARLVALGLAPRRTSDRVLVDVEQQVGRVIRVQPRRERWVFASVAAKRSASYALSFDSFVAEGGDISHLRHVVLRPRGRKVALGELDEGIRQFASDYDRHVGRLVSQGLVQPIAMVVHIRFDHATHSFDLHAHAMWRVHPDRMDAVLQGIQTRFSTTWISDEPIKKAGALLNYALTWVIDHRTVQTWPDSALEAVWKLDRAKLIRPAGEFQVFRRTLTNVRLVRQDGAITAVEKKRRRKRSGSGPLRHPHGATLGYVHARIDKKVRWCAIAAVTPSCRLTARQIREIVARSHVVRSKARAEYTTTTTGSTPAAGPITPPAPPLTVIHKASQSDAQRSAWPQHSCVPGCFNSVSVTNADAEKSLTSSERKRWKLFQILGQSARRVWLTITGVLSRIVRRNE